MARRSNTATPDETKSTSQAEAAPITSSDSSDSKDLLIQQLMERLEKLEAQAKENNVIPEHSPVFEDEDNADLVLFLYAPKKHEKPLPETYFMIPVPHEVAPMKEGDAPTTTLSTIAVIPGIQEIPRSQANDIMSSKAETIQKLIDRRVLQIWSEETSLIKLGEGRAQDAIALTEGPQLLAKWTKQWHSLPKLTRDALTRREEELRTQSAPGSTRRVFGQTIRER